MIAEIKMGDVRDFRNFMGAVIDDKAFKKISGYIADAKKNATIIAGGGADDEEGYFIEPTVVQAEEARLSADVRGDLRAGADGLRLPGQGLDAHAEDRGLDVAVCADRRGVRRPTAARSSRRRRRCATPPATSTSTTSRPARWSASSRSAARARRAPTTRRDRR